MPSTVKSISVEYEPINKSNTFTSGDHLTGKITLELAKGCTINSLSVKLKGKAEVLWTERRNKSTVTYYAKDKYFSIKQFIIQGQDYQHLSEGQSGETYSNDVDAGCHVYPFTFQIPEQDMPPSFNGAWGKVLYRLEANLCRSLRLDSKAKADINFITKGDLYSPELMAPQHGTKDKRMNLFTRGTVAMDINIDRTGFYQGEGMKIMASIQNNSSREIKPKYCLYRKESFFARGRRRLYTADILKEVGEPIPPSTSETVTRIIRVPPTIAVSILNCSILKLEYRLRVYLDVKYDTDPTIKFPIVILLAPQNPNVQEPSLHFGHEAFRIPGQPECSSPPQYPTAPTVTLPATQNPNVQEPSLSLTREAFRIPGQPESSSPPQYSTAPTFTLPTTQNPNVQEPSFSFDHEVFRIPGQPEWSSPPQYTTAPEPSAPPPPYDTYGKYPPVSGFDGKS